MPHWWLSLGGWLGDIAAVVGPLSIIIGLPGAVIGSVVGIVKVRRWALDTLVPAQEATVAAAERAETAAARGETAATVAEDAKIEASKHAKSAGDSALELRETNGKLVTLLPAKEWEPEYLREQNSRLVAELVIQASKHPEDFKSPTAPKFDYPVLEQPDEDPRSDELPETEAIFTTGRHALPERTFQSVFPDEP